MIQNCQSMRGAARNCGSHYHNVLLPNESWSSIRTLGTLRKFSPYRETSAGWGDGTPEKVLKLCLRGGGLSREQFDYRQLELSMGELFADGRGIAKTIYSAVPNRGDKASRVLSPRFRTPLGQ